jgi:hypothetical protein
LRDRVNLRNAVRVPRQTKSNLPVTPLRWSVEKGAQEFAVSISWLRKALAKESIVCASDSCFSTQEICRAVFGSLREERLRKERELSRKYRLENEITEATLLNRSALGQGFTQLADAMSNVIMSSSSMTRHEKEDFLANLASWPIILDDVGRTQSKLRSNGNGDGEEGCDRVV